MPLMRGGLRSMGFLQDLRKRLDEDTKVKEIKEAIKKVRPEKKKKKERNKKKKKKKNKKKKDSSSHP